MDHFHGNSWHKAEQKFHVAPNTHVEWIKNSNRFYLEKNGAKLIGNPFHFSATCQNKFPAQLLGENATAELDFGNPLKTIILSHTFKGVLPFCLGALLVPGYSKSNYNISLSNCVHHLNQHGIEINFADVKDQIFINPNSDQNNNFLPGWQTNAKIIILRYNSSAQINYILMGGGNYLMYNNQDLVNRNVHQSLRKIII